MCNGKVYIYMYIYKIRFLVMQMWPLTFVTLTNLLPLGMLWSRLLMNHTTQRSAPRKPQPKTGSWTSNPSSPPKNGCKITASRKTAWHFSRSYQSLDLNIVMVHVFVYLIIHLLALLASFIYMHTPHSYCGPADELDSKM